MEDQGPALEEGGQRHREELFHVHDFSSRYQGDTGSFAAGLTPVKSSIVFLAIFSVKLSVARHFSTRLPGSQGQP